MDMLLPDRLKALWARVETGEMSAASAQEGQASLVDEYRAAWTDALVMGKQSSLRESLMGELAAYLGRSDVAALEARCRAISDELKSAWDRTGALGDRASIERFYDEPESHLLELMWWHTVEDDASPLAYVLAWDFARRVATRRYLDFGSGVGSGSILFARHGYEIALADISSPLLQFARWRLDQRGLEAEIIDLKAHELPADAFDVITTMDVFEHLADPEGAVDDLARALKPGGYIFGRFAAEPDSQRPQHIVFDFEPTFRRLAALGFAEVWKDEWLWGHRVFRKRG